MKWINALLFFTVFLCTSACEKKTAIQVDETEEEGVQEELQIYIPNEFKDSGFEDETGKWSYTRSKQSEHFIVFWEPGYGDLDPSDNDVPATHRVDIDDLLQKAEQYYDLNVNTLKFAERGVGQSKLDEYKMMIFLHYTTDWMAYGGGYDDVIGALWISPNTAQPVGSTIAHEIGHSFQYQVRCDLGSAHGFRYGFGGNDGNGFWEQTAQWQAHQSYPSENFETHHFSVYTDNYHRHQIHELYRYANYFIHHYWADKHGLDIIGRIWREAVQPEDPIQAYKRIVGVNDAQFNDELYDMAKKFVTWDIDALRDLGAAHIGKHAYGFDVLEDGSLRVTYERCPGTTGYNVVPLEVPAVGTEVSIDFTGIANASGFNQVADAARAGWRYGYVALLENGNRVYGDMHSQAEATAKFTVPQGTEKLWFVVTGAPSTYMPHAWDEDESNDDQWPYQIKVHNTGVVGYLTFDEEDEPENVTFSYEVSFPRDDENYTGTTVAVNPTDLGRAFLLQPNQISSSIGSTIKFYAVESDGGLNPTTTANGYGHWFDSSGDVISWGDDAMIFSEFNESTLTFSLGQFPNRLTTGATYTVKQALVYEYEPGNTVRADFVFHITIE